MQRTAAAHTGLASASRSSPPRMLDCQDTPRRLTTTDEAEALDWLRCRGRTLDIEEFHLQDEHGVGRDDARYPSLPIRQVRTDDQAPAAAHPHAEEAEFQPRDDLTPAQVHAQRPTLIVGTSELVPAMEE